MLVKDYRRLLVKLLIRSYQKSSAAIVEKHDIITVLHAVTAKKYKPKKKGKLK